jgi:hypothetical protein
MANLKLLLNDEVVQDKQVNLLIGSYGKSDLSFTLDPISKPGNYTIEVTLVGTPYGNVKSIRNFKI